MIKIANAQGFWGDSFSAPKRLVEQQPDLDYLTLDYLAEVSLSIMAIQRDKDPSCGFAKDFLEVVRALIPHWKAGGKLKIVTNAGGLNPEGCAEGIKKILKSEGLLLKVGVVSGDDVLSHFPNESFVTANAYLGAKEIVEALKLGATIVVTGRVADPSLTVAPALFHFNWSFDDYDRLASATIAGHLIECGTQVTGGFSTHWMDIPLDRDIGFPVVEIEESGEFIITKPNKTAGAVTEQTVKEQLLYEIGDPANYLSPDVTVSFLSLKLSKVGKDRIHVSGAKGLPPPKTLKVSATYRSGYKTEGMITIFGKEANIKAKRCGKMLLDRLKALGKMPQKSLIECLGAGDAVPGIFHSECIECVLRVALSDPSKAPLEAFSKELASLVTAGPQGITGYSSGRPKIREVFGFSPRLIEKSLVVTEVEVL